MRITLAGFGGALAGISISRRGGLGTAQQALARATTSSNVIKQSSQSSSRQQRGRQVIRSAPPVLRPSIDRELPSAWAVACMAFAGVVEFSRLVSPTTFVSQFITPQLEEEVAIESENAADTNTILTNIVVRQYGTTIIDYMIGGSIAGALFKGSAVRTPAGARIDASIMGSSVSTSSLAVAVKGKPLSGILPGAALGLLAGVTVVAIEYAQTVIEEKFGVVEGEEAGTIEENITNKINNKDDVPADIKAMSTQELMASIEKLKRGRDELSSKDQEVESESDEEQINIIAKNKPTDLLYTLGFRPHSSS